MHTFSAAVSACLPDSGTFVVPDPQAASALRGGARTILVRGVDEVPAEGADVVALLADELSTAGADAEGLLARSVTALRTGGLVALTAANRVYADALGDDLGSGRGFSADELARLLGHRGCTVELLSAPGVTARLAGRTAVDLESDRRPGLLDAAPRLFAVARTPPTDAERSRAFFAALPRKVIAAAVLCRSGDGRVVIVHDSFRGHWTIPGGVVEPDEDPKSGAEREAWEETGLRIRAGAVLGTFAGSHPDRIVFVYDAAAEDGGAPAPSPVHTHEIDGARWVRVDEALRMVAPYIAFQIRSCLRTPHHTWRHEPPAART